MKITQLAHGRVIPNYSSAYSLRCHNYLSDFTDRKLLSVSGLVFKDRSEGYATQYRSILNLVLSILKGNRSLEYLISRGKLLRRKYISDARRSISASDIVVFEGPWQYRLFKDHLDGKIVILDAHNVESALRKGNKWEAHTFELEKEIANRADLIITVSKVDYALMLSEYGPEESRVLLIPEGIPHYATKWKGTDSRDIVFIGSAYLPNILAVKRIIEFASKLPEFEFKIIGNVKSAIRKRGIPSNVKFLGSLDEQAKSMELCNALMAINPVEVGSGRNYKMNDYIGHGVPIVTTSIGTRGFEDAVTSSMFISTIEEFPDKIASIAKSPELMKKASEAFTDYSEKHGYENTSKQAYEVISSLSPASH